MTTPHDVPDEQLLASVAALWETMDPPPVDLADGVLARLAAQDLEVELLTLVETEALAGVRHAEPDDVETGSWTLEYAGDDFRAYLRLSRIEDETRLDGWIVPARELRVELRPEVGGDPLVTVLDEFGRFELASVPTGLHRLAFLEADAAARPRLTPPFWI